ncbi:hypothetical protein Tco_0958769, partial [Tanacetum coccineum]
IQLGQGGDVVTLKRGRDDQDKDEDPSAGSDRGIKRRKLSKDIDPSKGSKSKESNLSSSSKGTQSQPKSSSKSTQAEELEFEAADTKMQQDQGIESGHIDDQPDNEATPKHDCTIAKARQPPCTFDELMGTPIDFSAYVMNCLTIDNLTQDILVGPAFNLLKGSCKSFAELEYHFEECYKAVNDQLFWYNPEGREYLFDLTKPLPFIEDQGRQVVPTDYFINNDLEYLKGRSSSSKYATSTTRTKATKYLEEIVVQIDDNVLYKFKEGDFLRLNLYLQLRVKSYQKKLNITRPKTTRSNIFKLTPYTAYKNPQGIIHQDKYKRNRLMRSDELYKFCDGTLSSVRRVLHDIASNLEMDYLLKRHWSNIEMKRSRIMVKAIDKLLFERRLMRNLEKFIGGRNYGNNLRLLERTI